MNDIESKPIRLPVKKEHPFKKMLKSRGLTLWQVSKAIGLNEATLSRQLNGIYTMPEDVETLIRKVLEMTKKKGSIQ